jgi:hypothetical protein
MPETYNPRERTFIKVPEVKLCPECGQPLPSDVKPMTNIMNNYISASGNRMVLNSDENILEIKGVKVYKAKQNPVTKKWESEFIPVEGVVTPVVKTPILNSAASKLQSTEIKPIEAKK